MAYEQTHNITNLSSYVPPCTGSRPIKPVEITSLSLLMPLSLIGNLLIVAVFYRNKTLRTPVHYFIVNMAVSDLIIPAVVLQWLITGASREGVWLVDGLPGSILCKFVYVALAVSSAVSIFSTTAIAVERFHGVLFAVKPALISRKTCRLTIAVTWTFSVAFWTYVYNGARLVRRDTELHCRFQTKSLSATMYKLWKISFISLSFLSALVLTVLYSTIVISLFRQKKNSHMASEARKMRAKENHKIARMLISVVLVFYAVSLPYNVMSLVHLLKPNVRYPCLFVWFSEKFLPTLYTAINPEIYYTCNENYYQGFRELLSFVLPFKNNYKHCFRFARFSQVESNALTTEQVNNSNEIIELQNW